jgi:hypothetical protein
MQLEHYTPRNILRAMGFVSLTPELPPDGWAARILLTPSFHPEVSVSLVVSQTAICQAEVRALASQLWQAPMLTGAEEFFSASTDLDRSVVSGIPDIIIRPKTGNPYRVLDGMSYSMFFQDSVCAAERAGHAAVDLDVARIVHELLEALLARITDSACSAALHRVLRYAESKPPTKPPQVVTPSPLPQQGWSPKRPKTFVALAEALQCPHCELTATRFRKLTDRLLCLACARSFRFDPDALRVIRVESEDTRSGAG